MNYTTDLLSIIGAALRNTDISPADGALTVPPLLVPVGELYRPARVFGANFPDTATDSLFIYGEISRTNQAAGEVNPGALGAGLWDITLVWSCVANWALPITSTFSLDLLDAAGERQSLLVLAGSGAAQFGPFHGVIKLRVQVRNNPPPGTILNGLSFIMHAPAAGVGQTNYATLGISAQRLL